MVVPALAYLAVTAGTPATRGWGIPMATDLAFVLGVLVLLRRRVPLGLKLFLLTLAIVDDTGSILVITLFYSSGVEPGWLAGAAGAVVAVAGMRALGVRTPVAYVPVAVALWACTVRSGVSATIVGVVLGLLTPARSRDGRQVLARLEHDLHPWASFVVVPLFALANVGVALGADALADAFRSRVTWGVVLARVAGKALGIVLATELALRLRLGRLPAGVDRVQVLGVGLLAAIGATVALLVADLSFGGGAAVEQAKIGLFGAALAGATLGTLVLVGAARRRARHPTLAA